MPLTRPIPEAAMPVVEIIRREVPRPRELPDRAFSGVLRFHTKRRVFCCPMGLCPCAVVPSPTLARTFGYDIASEAVKAFALWWDDLDPHDPQAAVDAVWPREGE